jgi:hypothetical protein
MFPNQRISFLPQIESFFKTMARRTDAHSNRLSTRSPMKKLSLLLFVTLSVTSCWTEHVVAVETDAEDAETQTCDEGTTSADTNGACSAMDAPDEKKSSGRKKYRECGLYLAESTIPNAGLGIFTAEAKKPNDLVGSGDVCIPNIDIKYHHGDLVDPFNQYYWAGIYMGMARESHGNGVEAYCPGLECAINCNLALINTHQSNPIYDYAGLHRARDPGAGAFTPYHNGTTYVSRHIPAGGELFKFYGNEWFLSRPEIFDGDFPIREDYAVAEEILRNMTAMKLDPDIRKELYEDIVVGMKKTFTSRTLGALPLTIEDAITAAEQDIAVLQQPAATRSIEWLQEHGRCIDNIEGRYSTIRQAGRGAFATRPLAADQVITTSPLHHLTNTHFFENYNYEFVQNEQRESIRVPLSIRNYQILANYCYYHFRSSMVLCPYGNGVNYINHNQTQANVKIRWAEDFDIAHNATRVKESSVADLQWSSRPQLAFDYVALRDIKEGEELFLDYGDDFEAAWQRHVASYKPPPKAAEYMSGLDINVQHGTVPLRTEEEQKTDPYQEHLQIRAHSALEDTPDLKDGMFQWTVNDYGFPARVLKRHVTANEHTYTLEIGIIPKEANSNPHDRDPRDREVNLTWVRREKVPRHAMAYFDKPGYTDMHLPNAFRHLIGIPAEIFPEQWKNGKNVA